MDKPIIERDVVLIGKDEDGNDTFDFPVTRLGNIENDAEIKEKPGAGDYLPLIDASDKGKMKKTSAGSILNPLNSHIADNTRHVTEAERSLWNGKAGGNHDHDDRYYTEGETDSKLNGKSDKNHTHSAATASAPGFMSPEDKKKLDGLNGGGIKSVQSVRLGSDYIYPTYTVPEGAEYYIMLFKFGTRCIFAGFCGVDVQADINTGDTGFRLYEPENAGPNYSGTDYIRVQREGDTLRIGAYQAVDGVTDAKMKGSVTIQMIFF